MSRQPANLKGIATTIALLGGILFAGSKGFADDYDNVPRVYWGGIPEVVHSHGTTPYAAAVHAEANFLRAIGDANVSIAVAREHHASAYQHEMENDYQRFHLQHNRRLWYRYYRDLQTTSITEQQKLNDDLMKYRVTNLEQTILKSGDPTDEINWLSNEVYRLRIASGEAYAEAQAGERTDPSRLDPHHLSHIRLTNQAIHGADGLVWRANDSALLNADWPYLLAKPEFAKARARFDEAKNAALVERETTGRFGHEGIEDLRSAWKSLDSQFTELYTKRIEIPHAVETVDYCKAASFLKSMKSQVNGLIYTNDQNAFDESYAFDGDGLGELVDHVGNRGLAFARPESGDRGTYCYLFTNLLSMYEEYQN